MNLQKQKLTAAERKLGLLKAVYSYPAPQLRAALDASFLQKVWKIHKLSVRPAHLQEELLQQEFGLDDCHEPVIEKVIKYLKHHVSGLSEFKHRYWVAGAHEGISETLVTMRLNGVSQIVVLPGEYEGFGITAQKRAMTVRLVDPLAWSVSVPNKLERWFFSDPNARDGNYLSEGFVNAIADRGHKVFLDLSYLAASEPRHLDVTHPNIETVVLSFSKPGLFYWRIGMLFSRHEIPGLDGNIWFKSVPAIQAMERVVEQVPLGMYVRTYKALQSKIVENLRREHDLPFLSSDAFLICHILQDDLLEISAEQRELLEHFRRDKNVFRFCLTPQFLDYDEEWWGR